MSKATAHNLNLTGPEHKTVTVEWSGREELKIDVHTDENGVVQKAAVQGIGSPAFLKLLVDLRRSLKGKKISEIEIPEGTAPEHLCFREAILKLKNEWNFPYQEEELCHCRSVLTEIVDQAICMGAHTPKKVSRQTSASTACGTCRPNVEAIIKFRLGKT